MEENPLNPTYSKKMWEDYKNAVCKCYHEGLMVWEISKAMESSEELVKGVIETFYIEWKKEREV